jgi:NH3-dependent NAD+ synthetase
MVNGRRRPNKTQLSLLQGKLQRSYFYLSNIFSNLPLNVKFIHIRQVYSHSSFFLRNQLDTRRLLKRLAKENLKPLGRMVAKLAHANPMTVLRTIVQQVLAT